MKRLNGSAKTGKKIMDNLNEFKFYLKDKFKENNKIIYEFEVAFNKQKGTFIIYYNDKGYIEENSTLNIEDFKRPLGIYNDPSLKCVAEYMLLNVNE